MTSQILNIIILLIFVSCQASGGGGGDVINHVQNTAKFGLSTTLNKTYVENDEMSFVVAFPYDMTITGSPELTLTIGGTTRAAIYESGDGLKEVTFKYTVQAGDNDLDGIVVSPTINLNGGTCTYNEGKICPTTMTVPSLASVKVDTISPTLNSVSAPIPSTYYASQVLVFTATFSEAVNVTGNPRIPITIGSSNRYASYASGSGTSTLLFSYTVTTADSDNDGISVSSLVDLNSGSISDSGNHHSSLNFAAPNTSAVLVAGANPIVTSITPPANATYGASQNLDFTLTFNKSVNVTGSPRLALTIGSVTKYANYISGSGTANIKYRYTVVGGDLDNDGIVLNNQISLNGGTIQDSSLNNAVLILIPPNMSGVKVLTTAPSILSITLPSAPANGYDTAQVMDLTVNFSEPMTETGGTSRLKLDVGGVTKYATYLSGSGSASLIYRYTVSLNDEDLNGIAIQSPFELNGATVVNSGSVVPTLTFTPPNTSSIKVDAKAPILALNTKPANGTYTSAQNLDFDVTYHEPVVVSGTPRIVLDIGGVTKYANYLSGTGTTTLKFRYTVAALDADNNGISVTTNIDLNSGTIKDLNNHSAGLTLTSTVTTGVLVDTLAPTISSLNAPASGTYLTGQNLDFTVNWSENVVVSGLPRLAIVIGSTTRYANYISGSNSSSLLFRYTVVTGDVDSDGIVLNSPVGLNGGSIKDTSLIDGVMSFTSPSTSGIIVGATTPTILSVTPPSAGTYTTGQNVDFTVNFSEPVVVTPPPRIAIALDSGTVYANYVSGGGTSNLLFRYTVAANDIDSDGVTLASPLEKNGGNIQNVSLSFDATLSYSLPSTSGILIDGIDAIISSVSGPAPKTYVAAEDMDFDVTYSSAVTVTGTPQLSLVIGSSTVNASYLSGTGTKVLKFRYTVVPNDLDTDGVTTASPLLLNSGSIKDSFGDNASLTFSGSTLTGVNVDAAAPSIASVTAPADGAYDAGQSLSFTVNFSENVTVTGTPRLTLTIGSTTRYADYVSGSGSSAAVFTYVLVSADSDNDGIAISSSLSLNGGTIADSSANNLAPLTFTAPDTSAILVSGNVAVAANSSISGSSPVVADGVASSTVTITLKNASNNAVVGVVPTFGATDTGTTNVYGTCSATDASGTSSCTLTSLKAETKTLSLVSPVTKTGGSVIFTNGIAASSLSTITGTSPVLADGTATSTITIRLKDANNNPVPGEVPTFSATDTGTNNVYGTCTATNASGNSTCTLSSLSAEVKTLNIVTPVAKIGGTVTFSAGAAVAANSSISGSGPVVADGSAISLVTIILKDLNDNPVSGEIPTFSATDTGTSNAYGTCTASNASGISTCTMSSGVAEIKTLSIATPVVKAGGTVTFTSGSAVAANSTIIGSGPVVADGTDLSTITITLKDASNNPVSGQVPSFSATDSGATNTYGTCSSSNASGISTCTLTSLRAETKNLSIISPVTKAGGTVVFTNGPALAATSTITGTSPVTADGTATSTVTVTLKDANNNPVPGSVPTFSATDTGTTNVYGTCSASNASGVSSCSLKSLIAEVKTLSIATPVVKADGTVTFTAGTPVAANSTITGSGPVAADGVATSTVTITLKDINNNPVSGQVPTFGSTGSTNTLGTCSSTNASGVSTCTLSSTTSETKTLSIATPVIKTGGTVVFTAGSAVAANSTITGTGPVIANGTATSTVTITLKDASNNPVVGQVPTFSATTAGNTYGTCSSTNSSGISTCTLKSTKAETKTLSIATPVVKADGTVVFTAGTAVAANSTITGTGPVIADDVSTSTVTITLKDVNNNLVSGVTPTFTATNTGSSNTYGACSASNASGESTCSLKSKKAETKTLSIATPFVKAGGTVVFNPGLPDAAHSDIAGSSPVSADGVSVSFITITIGDSFGNPIAGQTPIFNATDTSGTNAYGACTVTNATGVSACTLSSTKAEAKTLQLTSPVAVTGDTPVTFSSTLPTAANSSIAGTGPTTADGATDSTITITLKDASNNAVAGIVPTFDATDTGTTNLYDDCSMSDASGFSVCTMTSTKAEVKTLRITNPVTKSGSTVTFTPGAPSATASTIAGTGPVVANGTAASTITIIIKDAFNNVIAGTTPTFSATNTGSGNTQTACSVTDATGSSTCTLKSTKAETKIPAIVTPVSKSGTGIVFTAGAAVAANSTITGTSPVNPDGTSTSTVTITLKDANNNNVSGIVPTFAATGTNNVYGTCSSTTAAGTSTCTLASTTAEVKTLSISTPVAKTGGTVTFQSGSAVAANSSITGTSTITANGVATSTVTITLKDSANAPVVAIVPTFTASGTNNTYNTCSATNSSGISTCTMTSVKAEDKTLEIASPVIKQGSIVTFVPGPASATTSTIEASDPNLADGSTPAEITITLLDAFNNAIEGVTPTYSVTGTSNTIGACSPTDSAGSSTCEVTSTKAEGKTVALVTPVAVAGNTVDFNPNGIDIQVPIEMIDRGLASNTGAINFARSQTSFDPADYVSLSNKYYFEIVADNTNTSVTYNIQLIDSTATVIADSVISIPPSTSMKRFRVEWTPNSAADVYRIRVPATATASQVKVHSAKIIVEQDNAVATKLYIPLIGGDVTGDTNSDTSGQASSTTTASFLQPSASNFNLWTRNDSNYDAIAAGTPWTLETVLSTSNTAGTTTVALFDKGNNQQITAATITQTGSTAVTSKKVSFASNATNFDNGDTLELRIRSSSTSYTAKVFKAGLWLKLKYLKKGEFYHRFATRRSTSSSGSITDARYLYEASAWSNPTVFFQTNANSSSSSVILYSHGSNDNGTSSPTAVTSITPTSTYSIQRSAALSMVNNTRYWVQHNRSSGTVTLGGAFLVIRATE
jgi:Bacterial Ig-like domain (group 1)